MVLIINALAIETQILQFCQNSVNIELLIKEANSFYLKVLIDFFKTFNNLEEILFFGKDVVM